MVATVFWVHSHASSLHAGGFTSVAGVRVPNGLLEALIMASATGGCKANGEYSEFYLKERKKMI
jgi:hypothetical protein